MADQNQRLIPSVLGFLVNSPKRRASHFERCYLPAAMEVTGIFFLLAIVVNPAAVLCTD